MIETLVNRIRFDINNSFSILNTWFAEDMQVLKYVPDSGGWTGLQILGHVMLTNHYLILLIEKGSAKAFRKSLAINFQMDRDSNQLMRKELVAVGEHRSFAWNRPEHMEPRNDISLMEIQSRINDQQKTCLDCLDKLKQGEGVLYKTTMTVNNLGKLNVYEYMDFLTLHIIRHLTQLGNNKREYLNRMK